MRGFLDILKWFSVFGLVLILCVGAYGMVMPPKLVLPEKDVPDGYHELSTDASREVNRVYGVKLRRYLEDTASRVRTAKTVDTMLEAMRFEQAFGISRDVIGAKVRDLGPVLYITTQDGVRVVTRLQKEEVSREEYRELAMKTANSMIAEYEKVLDAQKLKAAEEQKHRQQAAANLKSWTHP